MKIHRVEQRSEEWFSLRKGMPCTTGFKNIITEAGAPTTGERRRKYMARLVAERLLGYSMDDKFENMWTRRGLEMEPRAAVAFSAYTGFMSLLDGCFITNDEATAGCSPDRVIGVSYDDARACVEIKCPAPWTHIDYLLNGPGKDYKQQVQGQMLIGEFEVNHFWSFHPQMPPCHITVERDDNFLEKLAKELFFFCQDLDNETERAREMGIFTPGREPPLDLPGVFPWTSDEQTAMQ